MESFTISHKQYKNSAEKLRLLKSIISKPMNEYNQRESEYLFSEVKKHETVIDKYNYERSKNNNNQYFVSVDVPVKLTIDNFKELHYSTNIRGISKFKLIGFNEFVYAKNIEHQVDIDYPQGGIFITDNLHSVDEIIISQKLKHSDFDSIVKKIYDTKEFDTNSKTEIFKLVIDELKEMYERQYS